LTLLDLSATTVLDVKKQLVADFGQPDVRDQRQIYCGSVMNNNQALVDFKLNENTCIHLVIATTASKQDFDTSKPCDASTYSVLELEDLCKLLDDAAATAQTTISVLTTIKTRFAN
jgi:hypothetical protein